MVRSFPPSPNITHKNPKPSPLSLNASRCHVLKKKGKQLQCRVFLCVFLCWKSPPTPQHTPTLKAIKKKPVKRSRCPFTVSYVFFRTILIVEQVRVVFGIPQTKGFFSLQKYFEKRQLTPKSKTQKKNRKQKTKKKKEKRKERTKPWIRRRMQQKKQTNPEKRLCFRSLSLVQV